MTAGVNLGGGLGYAGAGSGTTINQVTVAPGAIQIPVDGGGPDVEEKVKRGVNAALQELVDAGSGFSPGRID